MPLPWTIEKVPPPKKSEKLPLRLTPCYNAAMERPSVYLETSVLSYLASRPSRDVIVLNTPIICTPAELGDDNVE